MSWVYVANEKLNTILRKDSENLRDFIDREPIKKNAIHKLDVCVSAEFVLQFWQAVLVEAFDEDNTRERGLMRHLGEGEVEREEGMEGRNGLTFDHTDRTVLVS